MIIFNYIFVFNWFQVFFCEKQILNVAGHGQNKSKMEVLKQGVDGFSYFSLIFSYFIFLQESYLIQVLFLLGLFSNIYIQVYIQNKLILESHVILYVFWLV